MTEQEAVREVVRERIYDVTDEMTKRAHDTRCPRPLGILLASWVNQINAALAALPCPEGEAQEIAPVPGALSLEEDQT